MDNVKIKIYDKENAILLKTLITVADVVRLLEALLPGVIIVVESEVLSDKD